MRQVTAALQARLDADATSFCHCWKLLRRDGVTRGFTDHDRDLAFDGIAFSGGAGLEAAATETSLGFAIGGGDVSGALTSDTLLEADLVNGLYDGATLETWLVDWSAPEHRLLLDIASLGEVRRTDFAFTAEVRSLAHRLDQTRGRRFQQACGADLGDTRCRVALDAPRFGAVASVLEATDLSSCLVALSAFAEGWFVNGRADVLDGANAGAHAIVRSHRRETTGTRLTFWTPLAHPLTPGNRLRVTAGCDKTLATCRDKFANVANFRGFPHIPGNDVLMRRASEGDPVMDGGSLFA